jgi:hypothetical protein
MHCNVEYMYIPLQILIQRTCNMGKYVIKNDLFCGDILLYLSYNSTDMVVKAESQVYTYQGLIRHS